jgi:hypothetical protein
VAFVIVGRPRENTKGGGSIWTQDGVVTRQCETVMCGHCGAHINTHGPDGRKRDISGGCSVCHAFLCEGCTRDPKCAPIEKRIELAERGVRDALTTRDIELAIARDRERRRVRRY